VGCKEIGVIWRDRWDMERLVGYGEIGGIWRDRGDMKR